MHIFPKEEITYATLGAAEIMLQDFYEIFIELYSELNCTHNVHLLVHLPRYVKLWGPLWTHNAFSFENKNRLIKNLFHSTNNVTNQILFDINMELSIQSLIYPIKLKDVNSLAQYN